MYVHHPTIPVYTCSFPIPCGYVTAICSRPIPSSSPATAELAIATSTWLSSLPPLDLLFTLLSRPFTHVRKRFFWDFCSSCRQSCTYHGALWFAYFPRCRRRSGPNRHDKHDPLASGVYRRRALKYLPSTPKDGFISCSASVSAIHHSYHHEYCDNEQAYIGECFCELG